MTTVRSFNDTSAVSVAYAITSNIDPADFVTTPTPFKLVPFTTEGFNMQKEAKSSTAIRGNRRTSGSKNTKGSAAGAVTTEFGANQICRDFFQLALMNVWKPVSADATEGTYITDSDVKQFMAVEKTVKRGSAVTDMLDHTRYYGTAVNEATIAFADAELITFALTTMSAFADFRSLAAGANGLGGSLASAKAVPPDYEIADSTNNLKNIEFYNADNQLMEVVWSDASLQIQNNVREQSGLSYEFAAGIGIGKVAATLSGEIYYVDQSVLSAHMNNKRMKAIITIATEDGTFKITLPNLMPQSPTNNAEGENADFTTSITMTAEEGLVTVGANADIPCVLLVQYIPAIV